MLVYLVSSSIETERQDNINSIKNIFSNVIDIEAIYPNKVNVPFLNKIKKVSKLRTGRELKSSEIGLLISHRSAWKKFLLSKNDNALFLESDSLIIDKEFITEKIDEFHHSYDIFFWGAFDGRIKIFKKNYKKINKYIIGKPVINSLYCTYGYSLNKRAAKYLLEQTNEINYPIDYWKKRIANSDLSIGGIYPEVVSTDNQFTSTIQNFNFNFYDLKFVKTIIDLKNTFIANFNA
jgi:GR25 family glycosyltransferase involved in LPS biosynthesis